MFRKSVLAFYAVAVSAAAMAAEYEHYLTHRTARRGAGGAST
jgi:hypothetical protein